jgi:uncharacterized membrane protein
MAKEKRGYITSTPKRSFIKAFTWETIAFIITLVAVYIVYGDIGKSIKFTLILTIIKIFILYFHERIWKRTMWGKTICKR